MLWAAAGNANTAKLMIQAENAVCLALRILEAVNQSESWVMLTGSAIRSKLSPAQSAMLLSATILTWREHATVKLSSTDATVTWGVSDTEGLSCRAVIAGDQALSGTGKQGRRC